MNFNEGDVVMLKSGGEVMTVEEVSGRDISCVWFDDKKKVARDTFPASVLEKYSGGFGIA